MRNHSYENVFDLHENETTCRTRFHMKGFSLRLVLKQRHKRTRKWPIVLFARTLMHSVACDKLHNCNLPNELSRGLSWKATRGLVMKPGNIKGANKKHDLCWKVHDPAQSFVLFSHTMNG